MNRLIRKWVPLWAIPVLLLMAIGTVWLRLSIIKTTYAINEADKMIRQLQQTLEQTRLKVTALRSPRRLESIARTKFGWTPPNSEQVIYLKQTNKDEHPIR
jgi:cell division protein FtsL